VLIISCLYKWHLHCIIEAVLNYEKNISINKQRITMKNLLLTALTVLSTLTLSAQNDQMLFTAPQNAMIETGIIVDANENSYRSPEATKYGAFGETIKENPIDTTYFRKPKEVKNTFTGFSIQLTSSKIPLARTDAIFYYFGGVKVENTNNGFSYLIGNFKSRRSAEKYLYSVLVTRFPKAKIIQYKQGKRVQAQM